MKNVSADSLGPKCRAQPANKQRRYRKRYNNSLFLEKKRGLMDTTESYF